MPEFEDFNLAITRNARAEFFERGDNSVQHKSMFANVFVANANAPTAAPPMSASFLPKREIDAPARCIDADAVAASFFKLFPSFAVLRETVLRIFDAVSFANMLIFTSATVSLCVY